jgi:hypothetical protein
MTPFRKYVSGVVPLTAAAIEKLNMQKGPSSGRRPETCGVSVR